MATDSEWGKGVPVATLNNPAPSNTYSDSPWGKTVGVLNEYVAPENPGDYLDSAWGKRLATLIAPASPSGYTDSNWGKFRAVVGIVVDEIPDLVAEPETLVEVSGYTESIEPTLRPKFVLAETQAVPVFVAGSSTSTDQGATTLANGWTQKVLTGLQSTYPSGRGSETAMQRSTTATFTPSALTGIHMYNAAEGGTTSANFLTSAERTSIGNLNPLVGFITIGANDFSTGISPATFEANLNVVLDDLHTKAPLCTFVLIHSYQRLDVITPAYPWSDYQAKLQKIVSERPSYTSFLSTYEEFAARGVPGTDPQNLVGADAIHATDAGYQLIADTVLTDIEGIRPIDQWIFTQASGPAVELVVNGNDVTFYAPSALAGADVVLNVSARKGTVVSAVKQAKIKSLPQTIWQGSTGFALSGVRPPVQATRPLV